MIRCIGKVGYFIAGLIFLLVGHNFAAATEVSVLALFKDKAMIAINGGQPRFINKGDSAIQGVRLLAADSDVALLEIDGVRQSLGLGQGATTGPKNSGVEKLTLIADARGHFFVSGSINGAPTDFLVDTGASTIALSAATAKRMGISYLKNEKAYTATAGGIVPVYRVNFNTVKVGGITLNQVEGVVIEGNALPVALLGMSFLNRVAMQRVGNTMTLSR